MRFTILASLLAIAQAATKYTLSDNVVDSSVCSGTKAAKVRYQNAAGRAILVSRLSSTMISLATGEKL